MRTRKLQLAFQREEHREYYIEAYYCSSLRMAVLRTRRSVTEAWKVKARCFVEPDFGYEAFKWLTEEAHAFAKGSD